MLASAVRVLLVGIGCTAGLAIGARSGFAEDASGAAPPGAGAPFLLAGGLGGVEPVVVPPAGTPDSATPRAVEEAPDPEPRRHPRGADGELYKALRRRALEEEERKRNLVRDWNDRLYAQLQADLRSPTPLRLRSLGPEIPDAAFLRAVTFPDWENAKVERHGLDRYVMGQLVRAYRRTYLKDFDLRMQQNPHTPLDEQYEEMNRLDLSLDETRLEWRRPFPSYWDGHPATVHDGETLALGERIEIARAGSLSLDNEMHLRADIRSFFLDEGGPAAGYITERPPAHARALRDPVGRGTLYNGDDFIWSGRIGFQPGFQPGSGILGLCREVSTSFAWTFFDPYDRKELFEVDLDLSFDPQDGSSQFGLLFSLARF
jgi:hypothetical protein